MGKLFSGYSQDTGPTTTDKVNTLDVETGLNKWSLWSDVITMIFGNKPATSQTGWETKNGATTCPVPSSLTYAGNHSYSLVFTGSDLTGYLSEGMRLRFTRTGAAPTQCTSLNGTTQYFNKTSPAGTTFTDDFVVSAWIKVSSYAAGDIISRYNGTSGWAFVVTGTGQLQLSGWNAGVANISKVLSYKSVPLGRWVHVAAQLDMSAFTATTTTSFIMIDGIDVSSAVSRGGTNPTALVQAGNLEVGSENGGTQFFPGKLAQVAVFSAKVTQATLLTYISQGLAGTETSLISAYSFNISIADLNTTNANNLTAQGGAVATSADSPFGIQGDGTISSTLEYGIITSCTVSAGNTTLRVQTPEGGAIPTSGGITTMVYSNVKTPYLFPNSEGKWMLCGLLRTASQQATPVAGTYYNLGSFALVFPVGEWVPFWQAPMYVSNATNAPSMFTTLSNSASAENDTTMTARAYRNNTGDQITMATKTRPFNLRITADTVYYLVSKCDNASCVFIEIHSSDSGDAVIGLKFALL